MKNAVLRIATWTYTASVLAVVYFNPPWTLFSLHPSLMALGFAFLPETITAFKNKKKGKLAVHQLFGVLTVICFLTATAAIYQVKETNKYPHYATWHGLGGLVVSSWIIIQASFGFLMPKDLIAYHRLSGLFLAISVVGVTWLHSAHPLGWMTKHSKAVPLPSGWEHVSNGALVLALLIAVSAVLTRKPKPIK